MLLLEMVRAVRSRQRAGERRGRAGGMRRGLLRGRRRGARFGVGHTPPHARVGMRARGVGVHGGGVRGVDAQVADLQMDAPNGCQAKSAGLVCCGLKRAQGP